ncbi:hypothetical protein CEXT_451351 [Caerostris extrusa]|uniref:Guanine nucleotide-binding protein subunit gamma n=1 Tax=Caerostris extrusa TaxID=172846 RepID=A0AAV4RRL6_CAEEX|nr:hypothetical protein CEXT_451351 [Caerostris extrusa]
MSNVQQRRKVVEQLRREASITRINVSEAVEDMKKYVQEHENEDFILIGFHSQKQILSEKRIPVIFCDEKKYLMYKNVTFSF